MTVILSTVHGSHLYGLARPGSDRDVYTVVAGSQRPRQTITGGVDCLTIGFPQWWAQCAAGVPQALEAMFAPSPTVDAWPFLRASYRVGGPVVRGAYWRTTRAFWAAGGEKRRVHSWRLWWAWRQIEASGWFDPHLTAGDVASIRHLVSIGLPPPPAR